MLPVCIMFVSLVIHSLQPKVIFYIFHFSFLSTICKPLNSLSVILEGQKVSLPVIFSPYPTGLDIFASWFLKIRY